MNVLLDVFVLGSLLLSVLLTIQSAYTLYLMLYTWDRPEAYQKAKGREEGGTEIIHRVTAPATQRQTPLEVLLQDLLCVALDYAFYAFLMQYCIFLKNSRIYAAFIRENMTTGVPMLGGRC